MTVFPVAGPRRGADVGGEAWRMPIAAVRHL